MKRCPCHVCQGFRRLLALGLPEGDALGAIHFLSHNPQAVCIVSDRTWGRKVWLSSQKEPWSSVLNAIKVSRYPYPKPAKRKKPK